MNNRDYLIDQQGLDWAKLLSTWHWLLPREFTVWLVNRFGDLFIAVDDSTVHMLDIGAERLRRLPKAMTISAGRLMSLNRRRTG